APGKPCVCPLCKESFKKKPDLHINRTLKEITEQFKKMSDALDSGPWTTGGPGLAPVANSVGGGGRGSNGTERPPILPKPTGKAGMPGDLLAEMKVRLRKTSTSSTPPPVLHPHPTFVNAANHSLPAPPVPRRVPLSGPADSISDAPPCPEHLIGLEYFCQTDQTCVCAACMEELHFGHQATSAKREWQIRKSQLNITEVELRNRIAESERKVGEIKTSLQEIQMCAEHETAGTVHVFSTLVNSLERSQAELLEVIDSANQTAKHRGQTLIRDLEQEIAELKKRSASLNQLVNTNDYVLFFKTLPTLSTPIQTRDWSDAIVSSDLTSGTILRTVNLMLERFQEELQKLPKIAPNPQYQPDQPVGRYSPDQLRTQPDQLRTQPDQLRTQPDQLRTQPDQLRTQPDQLRTQPDQLRTQPDQMLSQPDLLRNQPHQLLSQPDQMLSQLDQTMERKSPSFLFQPDQTLERYSPNLLPQSQPDLSVGRNQKVRNVMEYAVDITLDPFTAHPRLHISEDGKQVSCSERFQPFPDCLERFDRVVCVLGRQSFSTGRHYWEVDVGGKTDWDLGVASHSINRKGKITVSPAHGYWFLSLRDKNDYAFRTEPATALGLRQKPNRIGIYVDCDKGQVSFYNVDTKTLIYTFHGSFTDSIHPFFSPCTNKSGRNEAPLIICPVSTPAAE
ncbi:hypothetical protein DPEC_G00184480, partial [Dallia pectoralis]